MEYDLSLKKLNKQVIMYTSQLENDAVYPHNKHQIMLCSILNISSFIKTEINLNK